MTPPPIPKSPAKIPEKVPSRRYKNNSRKIILLSLIELIKRSKNSFKNKFLT